MHVVYYVCRKYGKMYYSRIASLASRHRTTVMYAVKKIDLQRRIYPSLDELLQSVERSLEEESRESVS